MASTKAVAAPKSAITHIQKTAPGPPMNMADATPARLPVPTRLERETAKAWNEPIFFSSSFAASVSFAALPVCVCLNRGLSPMALIMSRSSQNCAPRILYVKKRAQNTSAVMTTYPQR